MLIGARMDDGTPLLFCRITNFDDVKKRSLDQAG